MNFFDIKKVVEDLPEREVGAYLKHILFRIVFLEMGEEYSISKFSDELKKFTTIF
jgi:hypothetical protein